jgi:phage-related protein
VAIVEAIPQIIEGIITAVLGSIPQIIQAGIDLLVALIEALPEIITTIVAAIPEIISGIVNAVINNIPQIVQAGISLLTSLIKNLPTIIATIVKAVPQIITGIVNALSKGVSQMAQVGVNLVKGLWQGIQSLASWLWNKVSGWISSIWDGICDFFGIHSPSDEMAWIGVMLVEGLAGAINTSGKDAVAAAEGMSQDINDVMQNLADDMTTALPTDFSVNGTVNRNDTISGAGLGGGALITIQQMIVRSEEDIRKISQELYNLIQSGSRAQGHFTTA